MTDEEKTIEFLKTFCKTGIDYCELGKAYVLDILNVIQKQESIIKNACYIIKKTNKQFKDFDDIKLNEYLYNFDKCATIREE